MPANATTTAGAVAPHPLTQLTQTATHTTAATAAHTAAAATHAATATAGHGLGLGLHPIHANWAMLAVVIGFLVFGLAAIVLAARRAGALSQAARLVARSVDAGDYIGIIRDVKSNTVDVVPLKRAEGYYVSADPKRLYIVVPYSHAENGLLRGSGKPVIFAVSNGDITAIQEDVNGWLAGLGLASLSVGSLTRRLEGAPEKAVADVIRELVRDYGEYIEGELRVNPRVTLAFAVPKLPLIREILGRLARTIDSVNIYLQDATKTMETMGRLIEEARLQALAAKRTSWMGMILVAGVVAMMLLLVYLAFTHHPAPPRP